nr:Dere\GG20951-PA [Haemonchus contortus]
MKRSADAGSREPDKPVRAGSVRRLSREATTSDREAIRRKKKGRFSQPVLTYVIKTRKSAGRISLLYDRDKRRILREVSNSNKYCMEIQSSLNLNVSKRRLEDGKKLKMKSMEDATVNEGSEGSDESETESEEIEVLITEELREYAEKLIIGKLSRHGFGRGKITKLSLYCVTICYVANVQNFMMFNYAVRRMGLSFIFPFVCCMTLIGFPMIYLEMALGQYTQGTVLPLFDRIAPISVGVGISASLLLMTSIFIDNDVMGRMVHILLKSLDIFGTEPTWDDCVGEGVREFCHSINRNCSGIKTPKGWVETDSERFTFR